MKLKNQPKQREQVPAHLRITCQGGNGIRLEAAQDGEDGKPKLRRFTMTAYTGGAMRLIGWRYPVVVDLVGLKVSKKSRPILKDHNHSHIVGHTDEITVTDQALEVAGVISGAGATAQEVIATSENGFPWQASLGATADKVVFITEGKTARANGRDFVGPVYIARKATLGEVSFVALGADDDTSARVAAGANSVEATTMEFEQWAADNGFQVDGMEQENLTALKAIYEKSLESGTQPPKAQDSATPAATPGSENTDAVARLRAEMAAETERIDAIRRVCGGEHLAIECQAIKEGWDVTKTELTVLRAERPQGPAIHSGPAAPTRGVLEAAACMALGFGDEQLTREYGAQTLEAAQPMRSIGLRELVAECARMEGLSIPRVFGDGAVTIRAGFSTMSLPGIMENVMNKSLLQAYEATPIAAFDLCSVGSVSDFKQVSRYRLLGTGGFEQIAADGELKHGKLSEQKYTNQADTYGQILMLTRRDIINDDLNAFMDIPRQMGRSGAQLVDELFFTLLLSNPSSFFSTGNGNYLEGADTAFSADALTSAKTLFRKQKVGPGTKAKDQKPINIRPEFLVTPVELETEAELLMGSAQLMLDGAAAKTKIPVDNPHRNKYRVISAPHLSDTYFTGASAKAWYLFAKPSVLTAFEIVFLNGRRTPVVERVEAPPNTLGMGFRSFLDVGINSQDFRGAVKIKGEA